MAQYFCVLAVVLLCGSYGVFVEARCPSSQVEAEAAAKSCLMEIGMNMDAAGGGGTMMGNDVDQMKQYCKDGTLQNALTCVEKILTDCKKENAAFGEGLKKAISISNLRNGFDYMCDNLQVLIDNGPCIAEQQGAVATCVQVETSKFQKELEARQSSGDMNQDDVWSMSCGFMDNLFMCQHRVYETNCGKELADVMTTFMQSAKPPVCADYSSGSTMVNASWSLLACLLGLYMYLVRD